MNCDEPQEHDGVLRKPPTDGDLSARVADSDSRSTDLAKATSASEGPADRLLNVEEGSQKLTPKHKRIQEVVTFGLALLGSILGLLNYFEAQQSAKKGQEIEINQHLADAWDLMGGEKGTTSVIRFVEDRYKLELANRLIEKALILDPGNARAIAYGAAYLHAIDKPKDAVNEYRRSLELAPKVASTYNNLGYSLRELGRLEEAIDAFHKATEIEPRYALAYYNLSLALGKSGDSEGAAAAYKTAIEFDPGIEAILFSGQDFLDVSLQDFLHFSAHGSHHEVGVP